MQAHLAALVRPGRTGPLPAPRAPDAGAARYIALQLIAVPALLACLAWCCEYCGLDMAISGWFVDASGHGFAWRDSVPLEVLGHLAARALPVLLGGLALCAAWPVSPCRRCGRGHRYCSPWLLR